MAQPIVQSVIVDIETQFNQLLIKQATAAIQQLDKSIEELQKEAVKLGDTAPKQFAKITEEIGQLTLERRKLDAALKQAEAGINKQTTALGKLQGAAGIAGQALRGLGIAFGLIEFSRFVTGSIQAAAQLEKMAKSFEAFGVNATTAKNLVNELDGLAATLPFEGEQIVEVAQNLIKFNISAKDTPKIVQQIAAIASGAGVSFNDLSDAYGRANSTGKVFGRDFLQLYKNIPGLAESISKSTGKTLEEVVKLGKQGKLSFQDFAKGIEQATGETGKYGQVLDQFGKSAEGTAKQFKEGLGDVLEEVGEALLPSVNAGLRALLDVIKFITPGLKVFGEVIGAAFSGITQFVQAIANAPGKIGELFEAIAEGRLKFGGRLFIIEEDKLEKDLEDAKKRDEKFIQEYLSLFQKAADKVGNNATEELSEEEKKRLDDLRAQLVKFKEGVERTLQDVSIEISDSTDVSKRVKKIGLDLERELTNLQKQFDVFKKEGLIVDPDFEINFSKLKDALEEKARQESEKISREGGIQVVTPIRITPEVVSTDAARQKFIKDAKELTASIQVVDFEQPSFFEKLFDLSDEDKQVINDQLKTFSQEAVKAFDTFTQAELDKTDFLISETEKRLGQLLSIQEGGNASQISLEQKRLDRLNEQRQKFIERQRAIDTAQIIANNAVTASESIKAIATAFGKGNVFGGIAASVALIATIASTVAAVQGQLNSLPKFWEGAENVGDKIKRTRSGRDGHLIWADGRERILTAKQNSLIPSFVRNKDVPGLIHLGLRAGTGEGLSDKNITKEQRETNRLLKQNTKLLRRQQVKIEILANDAQSLRLKRMAI